jgi:hypothetical protein
VVVVAVVVTAAVPPVEALVEEGTVTRPPPPTPEPAREAGEAAARRAEEGRWEVEWWGCPEGVGLPEPGGCSCSQAKAREAPIKSMRGTQRCSKDWSWGFPRTREGGVLIIV